MKMEDAFVSKTKANWHIAISIFVIVITKLDSFIPIDKDKHSARDVAYPFV